MSLVKIHDIEVMANLFLYLDVDIHSDEINIFVIHPSRNDLVAFCEYILSLKGLIGFNNLKYDSQVIEFILRNKERFLTISIDEIVNEISEFSQETINKQDVDFPTFPERDLSVFHCDLMRIHHFDNKGKQQSLKGLQCNLNWHNVQEMPFDFKKPISKEELPIIIDYCRNDILSTKEFYKHKSSQEAIDLRKGLAKSYNLPSTCINWSDSKIGSELVLKFYCEYTGKNPYDVRKLRTKRSSIALKDCIPSNVSFKTKEFNWLLRKFQNTILHVEDGFKFINEHSKNKNNKEEICVQYKGLNLLYGTGGVHGSLKGIFEPNEDQVIYDIDVSSLYPSIAIANNYYPEHLGPEFIEVYRDKIVEVRLSEKRKGKNGNKAIITGLKNAANSVYGKSNDMFSFLYDPKYTFSTTITGQLWVSMLVEELAESIENCKILYTNTDSVTILLYKNTISQFQNICSNWEKNTKLELEGYCNRGDQVEVLYKKLYLRDVNNYCAITSKGEVKLKGAFEKNKLLYKDPSARIVTLALEEYIVNNIPIEETINKHDKIWDFLKRQKFKRNSEGNFLTIDEGRIKPIKAQKVARYYISPSGSPFVKRYIKSEIEKSDEISNNYFVWKTKNAIEKGWLCKDANVIENENAFNYDIDRNYYIEETYKIINTVESNKTQLELF